MKIEESDCSHLLGAHEATLGILCPLWGSPVLQRHQKTGAGLAGGSLGRVGEQDVRIAERSRLRGIQLQSPSSKGILKGR